MPCDIAYLKGKGISSDAYRSIFETRKDKKSDKIKRLESVLAARIKDGREANLANYRTYWAIDLAHETPFAQTTPTLVQNLLSRNLTAEETANQLAAWGLSEKDLFLRVDIPGGYKLILNAPVFFQVAMPVVNAYHTARTAMIYNERDRSPLFPFTPLKQTDRNRVLCDIWTDIVDTISTWYGYPAYLKQGIQQMLKYGVCLSFPMEEWHYEKQHVSGSKDPEVQKEGLRYIMPHPTRLYWDLYHPLPTINTDSGCEFALHWSVVRYGDIADNKKYWNREVIAQSGTDWFSPGKSGTYFKEVYPCTMRFPRTTSSVMSREEKAAFYSTSNRDDAVFLTTTFWKIVPKDWGLGDYEFPVWHRFDTANDDTIIWAAPCAYNPVWFMGYDWDSAAGNHSSLSLEAIPWQDHLGNLLSQMILTGKQNLDNIVYYDKQLVSPDTIKQIENLGEGRYRARHFIPYDPSGLRRVGIDPGSPFNPVRMEQRSIVELQSMLSTALNLMERQLQFSSQELGGAASHYQSAKEIGVTSANLSQRRNYTATGVDEGIDAWKQQIVDGAKAYMNNDVVAQVSTDIPDWEKHIQELGFTVKELGNKKALVAGKKNGFPLESFSRSNLGPQQSADPAIAQVIFQTVGVLAQKPELTAEVGVPKLLKLLEAGAKLAGAPKDFDITSTQAGETQAGQLAQQIMPLLEQVQESVLKVVNENVAKPVSEALAQQGQELQAVNEIVTRLEAIVQTLVVQSAPPQPPPVEIPVMPPEQMIAPPPEEMMAMAAPPPAVI